MSSQQRSTNLRQRLSLPAYQPVDADRDEFVETIRIAVRELPGSGSKRHRVLHAHDNCARALRGVLTESTRVTADDLFRVGAAINRAIADLARRMRLVKSAACYKVAIGAETAINGEQNNDSIRVLTSGTIGDLEDLWESSRVQRDMSQAVMDSVEVRITELRAGATR